MAEHSLLWAYQWHSEGPPLELPTSELNPASTQLRWVHLQCDAPDAYETLESLELAPEVIEALLATETRPRSFKLHQGNLILLRGINRNPGAEPDDMISLRIWFTPNLVITARKQNRRLFSVQDLKQRIDDGEGPESSSELVVQLIDSLTDRVHEAVESMEDELSELELALSNLNRREVQPNLILLRRQAASIRRYLAPQRDALEALQRHAGLFNDAELFHLREQADRTTRYVEELELVRERAVMLQDELRNQISEQQNVRMYILSLITVIFLPLSFLTGIFGMNVAGLPGTEDANSFAWLAYSMGAIGVVIFALMRWLRWFN